MIVVRADHYLSEPLVKRVIAVGYSLPLATSRAMQPSTCRFADDEIGSPLAFLSVTPFDSYGNPGKALEWKGELS